MFSSAAGRRARLFSFSLLMAMSAGLGFAHGDVTPHPVDTTSLKQLGDTWLDADPYRGDEKAIEIGADGYKHNCAACHGLDGVSGGMAPDLLKLTADCLGMAEAGKASCLNDTDEYFRDIVLNGKKNRDGRVTMPGYEEVFTQEAVWAIKAYLDQRTVEVN